MNNYEKEEDKLRMLKIMGDNHWETETNKDSSYEKVEKDFEEMINEFVAIEADMGINYDAEN